MPAATGGAASGPANLDVNKLLASLAAGGLLPMTAPAPAPAAPPPPPRQDHTSSLEAMVARLYSGVQAPDGLRFDEGKRDELREHLDWLFKRNMRGKAKGTAPPSRRWMLSIDAWVKHKADQEADVEKAQGSVFDSLEADGTSSAAEQSADADLPVRPADGRGARTGKGSRSGERRGGEGEGSGGGPDDALLPHARPDPPTGRPGSAGTARCFEAGLLPVWGGDSHLLRRLQAGVDAARRRVCQGWERSNLPLGLCRAVMVRYELQSAT